MANYIDPDYYDSVMLSCKQLDKLSDEAIRLFKIHVKEVSTTMNGMFDREDDREDAMAYAMEDFFKYWRGWKINPICKLDISRIFVEGESIRIHIVHGNYTVFDETFVAKFFATKDNEFKIESAPKSTAAINKTLDNLNNSINSMNNDYVSSYLHKVTKRINIIDKSTLRNSESHVYINKLIGSPISSLDKSNTVGTIMLNFGNPPPAFNYLTSLASNGLRKAIKKMYPKIQRSMVNFSEINSQNGGGLFNI